MSPASMASLIRGVTICRGYMRPVPAFRCGSKSLVRRRRFHLIDDNNFHGGAGAFELHTELLL
jgi:hypothetical protein